MVSSEGLGIVRDRFGFKPLMLAETDDFVAVATEEIALRRALPGDYSAVEPPPGAAIFYPLAARRNHPWFEGHTRDDPDSSSRSATIDCGDLPVRAINQAIRAAIAAGATEIRLLHPAARHNLGVALPAGFALTIEGSVGYYVAGLNDGATVIVHGGAGWGAGESMRDGTVVIDGNAGNAVAASIRAGTVVVRGDASTRAGIAMKGGMLIVAGNVGPMAGFMMQKGLLDRLRRCRRRRRRQHVRRDGLPRRQARRAGGRRRLRGRHRRRSRAARAPLSSAGRSPRRPAGFRKLVAGKRLWNFQQSERDLWKSAL